MTTDLKSTCLRFEQHCDGCRECDVIVRSGHHISQEVETTQILFQSDTKPNLCAEGKTILLEIFE